MRLRMSEGMTNDIAVLRDSRHLPGMSAYSYSPWFLLIVLALSVGQAVAQPTVGVPYQPDAEPDGLIGASDLLSLLGLFGTVYTPDEVTVDGVPLATAWQEECEEEEAYADLDGAPEGAVAVFYDGQWVLLEDNALDCAIGFGCTDPAYLEFDSLAVIDDANKAAIGATGRVAPALSKALAHERHRRTSNLRVDAKRVAQHVLHRRHEHWVSGLRIEAGGIVGIQWRQK